ncbi:MAG: formylmethanofuran dehydrogenase subunit C [Methylotenera sp.]|nr:formylmethanofuran dehydrogenase subunit C [Methylotenera sp.]MSP99267.1 formylmethanofuran dehydrogenase subunit C [Methylotenera sp.]
MNALTFTLQKSLRFSINCSTLTPSHLANKSISEISGLLINYGKNQLRVDEIFNISGNVGLNIHFKNTSTRLDYLGANMASGCITIEGDAGAYLGFGLKAGIIRCQGNTLAFAACNMLNGLIIIDGNTGDFLGGASAGLRKGMAGGTVVVKGNAGDRAGDQMRRGLILIEGNVGDYCASRMVAGTIGVLGKIGDYACFNMRRGTLLITKLPKLHVTMQNCGTHSLPFLNLMFKSFEQYNTQFSSIKARRVQRFVGDAACNGNGEILLISDT